MQRQSPSGCRRKELSFGHLDPGAPRQQSAWPSARLSRTRFSWKLFANWWRKHQCD